MVDLRGVCDRFLFGVRLAVSPVFFLSPAMECLVFLSGVLMRALTVTRLLGVARRGEDRVFEADSRCGDGFALAANPLLRGLVNDRVSILCAADDVSPSVTELDGKQTTRFLYGDTTDFLRHCNSFLSSSFFAVDLLYNRKINAYYYYNSFASNAW